MKQKQILFLLILISGFAKAQLPFTPKGLEMICHKVNQWDIDPILVDSLKFTYDNNFSHDTSKIYTKFYGNGGRPTINLTVYKHTNSLSKVSDVLINEVFSEDIRIFTNQLLEMGYKDSTDEEDRKKDVIYYSNGIFGVEVFKLNKESSIRSIGMGWIDNYPLKPKNQQDVRTTGCIYGDCMDGDGKFISDTMSYVGNYKNGMMDGFGKLSVHVGDILKYYIYEGNFKEGMKHGKGKWTDRFGTYDGNWFNDEKSGYGTFTDADYNYGKSSGQYEHDRMNGNVTFYNKDGKVDRKKRLRHGKYEDSKSPDLDLELALNTILNDFENEFNNIKGKISPDDAEANLSKVNLPGFKSAKIFHDNLSGHTVWKAIIPCDGTEADARKKYDEMVAKLKIMPMDCCNFKDDKEESGIEYYTVRTPYVLISSNKIYSNLHIKTDAVKLQSDNKWVVNFYIYYQDGK